jgi:hypothetical protein
LTCRDKDDAAMPIIKYAKALRAKAAEKRLRAMADSAAVPGNSEAGGNVINSDDERDDDMSVVCNRFLSVPMRMLVCIPIT